VSWPSSYSVEERRKDCPFTPGFLLTLQVLAYFQRQTTFRIFHNLKTEATEAELS
jgi:hypothetical protein